MLQAVCTCSCRCTCQEVSHSVLYPTARAILTPRLFFHSALLGVLFESIASRRIIILLTSQSFQVGSHKDDSALLKHVTLLVADKPSPHFLPCPRYSSEYLRPGFWLIVCFYSDPLAGVVPFLTNPSTVQVGLRRKEGHSLPEERQDCLFPTSSPAVALMGFHSVGLLLTSAQSSGRFLSLPRTA